MLIGRHLVGRARGRPNAVRSSHRVLGLLSKLLSSRALLGQKLISGRALRIQKLGARTRIRTRDQLIKSQLLCQLSYAGSDKS